MAYKSLGVWSLVLAPDSEGHIFRPSADLLITGAILGGEELVGRERSTVQLVHVDQSDDESDDEDDEDCESCEDDEEDDDEIDAQIDVSTDELMKNSEEADEQDEEEDDDDEEDDSEFDEEDFDDEEDALKSVTIASLYPQMIEQAVLNLKISAGETVMLRVTGSNEIHLVGNYVATPFGDDEDDFDDFDEDEDYDSDIDDLIDDEEAEEADEARIEEIEEELDLAGKLGAHIGKATKRKAIEESMQEDVKKAAEDLKETGESTTSKKAAKKAAKKMKMSDGAAIPTEAANSAKSDASTKQSKPAASNKKVHDNGLIVEDIKIGEGADAKKGNKIQMRYIGKLTNGKIFDQNTSNKPFKFILGKGEVIKGWDQGIAGMKVGGERRLTVPANLAYGKQAQGGIPANSTLIFEVKMIGCN